MPQFRFKKDHNLLKTYISDQMLKKGFLASNIVYVSLAHKKNIIDKYIKELDKVFYKISKMKKPKNQIKLIEAHTEIKRLN